MEEEDSELPEVEDQYKLNSFSGGSDIPSAEQKHRPSKTKDCNSMGRNPNFRKTISQKSKTSLRKLDTYKHKIQKCSKGENGYDFTVRRGNVVAKVKINKFPECDCPFWKQTNITADETCCDIQFCLHEAFGIVENNPIIWQVVLKPNNLNELDQKFRDPKPTFQFSDLGENEVNQILLNHPKAKIETFWVIGKQVQNGTSTCRSCRKQIKPTQLMIYTQAVTMTSVSEKPLYIKLGFCLNDSCPKVLPQSLMTPPEVFKLEKRNESLTMTDDEVSFVTNHFNIEF